MFCPRKLLALTGFVLLSSAYAVREKDLIKNTTSGRVRGFINHDAPNVVQFLSIPFAEPPVGQRRWLPPDSKSRDSEIINATTFGKSCSQFFPAAPNIFNTDTPEAIQASSTGEAPIHCKNDMMVRIWAPKHPHRSATPLPVIVWLYGGAFYTGGANTPYQIPTAWVERGQHIVVAVNYRLNIFGFPNAAGLADDEQNLGLLDQRLAFEWIRDNIANFGGDPGRIVAWGQSAGAMSIDYYTFAYPEDAILSGLIMNSGTALLAFDYDDPTHSNFTFVASHLGCGNLDRLAEIKCMREVDATAIVAFLEERDNAGSAPALTFIPTVDNRTKFADYTERARKGAFSKVPAIIGTTTEEGVAFEPYDRTNGPNQANVDLTTLTFFLCPAIATAQNRYAANATTFQYLYAGNFSNISPLWWQGAYHGAELPLIFGTSDIARGNSTPFEIAVSHKMQDYWVAFARDPQHGLSALGWNAYDGDGLLLAWNNTVSQPISQSRLGGACT